MDTSLCAAIWLLQKATVYLNYGSKMNKLLKNNFFNLYLIIYYDYVIIGWFRKGFNVASFDINSALRSFQFVYKHFVFHTTLIP